MKKVLLIICDGLGDRPISQLNYQTPLAAAKTPNLDYLAKNGITGLMHTIDVGIRPGSDVSHLTILGYDIARHYTGRGPFEVAGLEMEMKPGDIAFRGNFATTDEKGMILDRRAGRIDETEELVSALDGIELDGVQVNVKKGVGHRAGVVFSGEGLNGQISDTVPHKPQEQILASQPLTADPQAVKTAKITNEFISKSREILAEHPINLKRVKQGLLPANTLLLRGAGQVLQIPAFRQLHGLKGGCVAGAGLYKGIARAAGMDILNAPGATGKPDTDVSSKIMTALTAFEAYDFIFMHIKATDSLAEDGNAVGKKEFIEKIDRALAPLKDRKDLLIAVTADHSTSSFLKMHTADPVPVLISAEHIFTDAVAAFDEKSVSLGQLGHIRGKDLMLIIKDYLGLAPLLGA